VLSALGRERRGERRRRAQPGPVADAIEGLRRARVLVVEDDDINRQVAQKILQRAGLEVELAHDGADGVAKVRAGGPAAFHAVLMDLRMLGLDGWEATGEIKRDPRFAALPIVALTADAVAGVRESCLAAGMCDFVAKPFEPADLLATLARWIRAPAGAPPSAPVAAEAFPVPIAGLDAKKALAHLGGDAVLLRRLLADFPRSHADDAARVRMLLARGGREAALRIAHTDKGLAGTFAAARLQAAASGLEAALRAGTPADASCAAFEDALAEVIGGLRSLGAPTAAPRDGTDPARLEDLLARLARLVEKNDVEAQPAARELSARLDGTAAEVPARELACRLEAYDFPGARRALAALSAVLPEETREVSHG